MRRVNNLSRSRSKPYAGFRSACGSPSDNPGPGPSDMSGYPLPAGCRIGMLTCDFSLLSCIPHFTHQHSCFTLRGVQVSECVGHPCSHLFLPSFFNMVDSDWLALTKRSFQCCESDTCQPELGEPLPITPDSRSLIYSLHMPLSLNPRRRIRGSLIRASRLYF